MTYDELWRRLATVYDSGEAKAIVRYVLEVAFGFSATDVYCGKVTQLTADERDKLAEIMRRLMAAEPVQYVLGRADFCGRTFRVAPGVLIPRPETEELCATLIDNEKLIIDNCLRMTLPDNNNCPLSNHAAGNYQLSIVNYQLAAGVRCLDIGTGSGCIAITLALDLPEARVTAWDVSEQALTTARENAAALNADVTFCMQDALCPPPDTDSWDIIVSNPPYICDNEREAMERNVLDYEPHEALFVPDNDPLLFYRSIAGYAHKALKPNGRLYFEINPLYANDMLTMLHKSGFSRVETRQDCFGKERFVMALKEESGERRVERGEWRVVRGENNIMRYPTPLNKKQ